MTHYHIFSEKKTLFNRYLIKKILSKGNFGNTYLVEDLKQNNKKFVLKEFLQNQKDTELNPQVFRLVKENANLLDKLNHKQIPQILHWLEQNNNLFLVQQYIEGYTYDQLLAKKKENNDLFSEEEVINFLKSLLLVIDYIHRKNIIHKNISPDNIIFSNQIQKPVLIDFAIVKEVINTVISGKDLSQNDTIFNKSGYSSPEQLNTGKCYKNSDIYSLGVTSLVLLTGKEPSLLFDSFEQEKIWHQYVNISEEFKDILDKMLAEDYKKRYNSAKEVLRELNKIDLSKKAQKNTAPTVNKLSIKHKFISQKTTFSLNKNLSFKINLKSQSIFLFSLLTILGLGGAIFVIKSPDITAICKTFNNCSKDTRYKEKFFQIVKKGDDILTNFNQVQNLDELIYHHERLKTIVTNLKKIPTDVKIFPQAQLQLKEYNQNLDEFKAKIDYEKAAEIKLNLILEEFDNLKTETEEANTINSYEIVKSEWVNLQGSLENFEQDLLIGATILAKIIESETQMKYINNQITSLLAEENGQELDAIAIKPKKETPDKINKEQPINKTQENNYTIDYVDLALVLTTLLLMYLIRL